MESTLEVLDRHLDLRACLPSLLWAPEDFSLCALGAGKCGPLALERQPAALLLATRYVVAAPVGSVGLEVATSCRRVRTSSRRGHFSGVRGLSRRQPAAFWASRGSLCRVSGAYVVLSEFAFSITDDCCADALELGKSVGFLGHLLDKRVTMIASGVLMPGWLLAGVLAEVVFGLPVGLRFSFVFAMHLLSSSSLARLLLVCFSSPVHVPSRCASPFRCASQVWYATTPER